MWTRHESLTKRVPYHLRTLIEKGVFFQGVVTLVYIILISLNRTEVDTVRLLLVTYLEVTLPFIGALLSILSFPESNMIEILFILRMAPRQILLEKLISVGTVIIVCAFLVTGAAFIFSPIAMTFTKTIFVWLAPTICLTGIGIACCVMTASSKTSAAVVGLIWILELMLKGEILSSPMGEATFLFLSWQLPESELWEMNRVVLCTLGLISLWFALKKLQWAEPFLKSSE